MDTFAHNREHVAKHAYTVMHTVHVLAHYAVCTHNIRAAPISDFTITSTEVFTSTSIDTWNHYKYFIIIQ